MKTIAVLLTCHNRKEKTYSCLQCIQQAKTTLKEEKLLLDIYLTDDGSVDGTSEIIKQFFPEIFILQGNGSLFWTGGMRNSWNQALQSKNGYDFYLLLNDDTKVYPFLFEQLLFTHNFAFQKYKRAGIYIGSTINPSTNKISYGGRVLKKKFSPNYYTLEPTGSVQECHLGNANIMLVHKDVVKKIGILSDKYTHGIADYDYTLRALEADFPVLICPKYCGECIDDHGKNWKSQKNSTLKQRISYLKSPLGLAYSEFMHYNKRHFPFYSPIILAKLWLKTFFPFIWDQWKKIKENE